MKGNDLPADDHVVLYVKPCMILEDGGADGSNFRLRPARPKKTGLSVNWLEAFAGEKEHPLSEVRRLFRLDARPNGRFAELHVDTILRVVSEERDTLHIVYDPLEAEGGFEADPSHAEIIGLTLEQIGDEPRSREEWERRGVYFLEDDSWACRLLEHALDAPAEA